MTAWAASKVINIDMSHAGKVRGYAPFAWPGYAKRSDSTLGFYDPEPRPASLITFRLLIEQIWLGILWVDAKES